MVLCILELESIARLELCSHCFRGAKLQMGELASGVGYESRLESLLVDQILVAKQKVWAVLLWPIHSGGVSQSHVSAEFPLQN